QLTHLSDDDQPQLADAVSHVVTRPLGKSGLFGWNKTGSDVDISPLVACTYAMHGAYTSKRDPFEDAHIW
ncbi:terminase, partial [Bifidobacteriaceae bacterium WP022]